MNFRESRLIGRTLEDVNAARAASGLDPTTTRYNSRNADANAVLQDQARADSLNSSGGPMSPAGWTGAQGVDPARLEAAQRQLSNASLAGQNQTFTAAAKPGSAIQYNPDGTVKGVTTANKAPVAGAMGKPGALGFNPEAVGYTDTSKLQPANIAGVTEDPATFEARKASIEQQNYFKMLQDQKDMQMNAGMVAAELKGRTDQSGSNQSATPSKLSTGSSANERVLASMRRQLASLPKEDQEYGQALLSAFQEHMALLQKEQSASDALGADSQASLQSSKDSLASFLNSTKKEDQTLLDFLTGESRDREKRQLDRLDQREQELKMRNERSRQRDKIATNKQKDENMQQILLELSAKGLSATTDSNLNARVRKEQQAFDDKLVELDQMYDDSEKDLIFEMEDKRISIEDSAAKERADAMKEYTASRKDLQKFGLVESSKYDEQERQLKEKMFERNREISRTKAAELSSLNDKMQSYITTAKVDRYNKQEKEKAEAWNQFTWAFENTNDPAMRQRSLDRLAKAGYDVTGIGTDFMTFDAYAKLSKIQEQQAKDAVDTLFSSVSGEYVEGGLDLSNALSNAMTGSKGVNKSNMGDIASRNVQLMKDGKYNLLADNLMSLALGKVGNEQAKSIRIRHQATLAADDVLGEMEKLSKDYGGQWKSIIENSKTFMEFLDKDPKFADLKSKLGYAQSQIRNEMFGAALTPQEKALSDDFLVNFDSDEMNIAIPKLKNLRDAVQGDIRGTIDLNLGSGSYDFIKKYRGRGSDAVEPSFDNILDIANGTASGMTSGISAGDFFRSRGSGISQGFDTPIAGESEGGLYSDETAKAWGGKHAGLDVKMPSGTSIPVPFSGKVISMSGPSGFKGGWGNTIVIEDEKGAQHRFSHLASLPKVKPGQQIQANSLMLASGNTGNSTGPHLDYRVKVNGKYVDPTSYLFS